MYAESVTLSATIGQNLEPCTHVQVLHLTTYLDAIHQFTPSLYAG